MNAAQFVATLALLVNIGFMIDYYWLAKQRFIEYMIERYKTEGRCPICSRGVKII